MKILLLLILLVSVSHADVAELIAKYDNDYSMVFQPFESLVGKDFPLNNNETFKFAQLELGLSVEFEGKEQLLEIFTARRNRPLIRIIDRNQDGYTDIIVATRSNFSDLANKSHRFSQKVYRFDPVKQEFLSPVNGETGDDSKESVYAKGEVVAPAKYFTRSDSLDSGGRVPVDMRAQSPSVYTSEALILGFLGKSQTIPFSFHLPQVPIVITPDINEDGYMDIQIQSDPTSSDYLGDRKVQTYFFDPKNVQFVLVDVPFWETSYVGGHYDYKNFNDTEEASVDRWTGKQVQKVAAIKLLRGKDSLTCSISLTKFDGANTSEEKREGSCYEMEYIFHYANGQLKAPCGNMSADDKSDCRKTIRKFDLKFSDIQIPQQKLFAPGKYRNNTTGIEFQISEKLEAAPGCESYYEEGTLLARAKYSSFESEFHSDDSPEWPHRIEFHLGDFDSAVREAGFSKMDDWEIEDLPEDQKGWRTESRGGSSLASEIEGDGWHGVIGDTNWGTFERHPDGDESGYTGLAFGTIEFRYSDVTKSGISLFKKGEADGFDYELIKAFLDSLKFSLKASISEDGKAPIDYLAAWNKMCGDRKENSL